MKDVLDAVIKERADELETRQRELDTLRAAKAIIAGAAEPRETARPAVAARPAAPPKLPAAVSVTEKRCRVCGMTKVLDDFHRHPRGFAGRDPRCKACKSKKKAKASRGEGEGEEPEPVPKPSRAEREVTRKAGEAWRQKPRATLLKERAELRQTGGMLRCRLPRAGEPIEAGLAHRDICGALVFQRKVTAHLEDVHGLQVAEQSDEFIAKSFVPAAAVEDEAA